jgi:hypothetical protein
MFEQPNPDDEHDIQWGKSTLFISFHLIPVLNIYFHLVTSLLFKT